MEILNKLTKIVADYKGEKVDITEATTFDDLGFDSLDTVDLMMQVEDEFGIEFSDELQVANVGELAKEIEKLQ